MMYQVNLSLIRQTRKSKGYSMQYMAKCLDISGKSNYFQREKGTVPFKATELQQVADILGLNYKKILVKTFRKSNIKRPEEVS
ncbi:transcriptional regulator [Levilactobacillus brevis]|nr:transcriptional regulator [Levilactobacillus brevis]ARN94850.1 transcriptional regulator [Levilactobacillus brevis]